MATSLNKLGVPGMSFAFRYDDVAHLVEHNHAKVDVAGSIPVIIENAFGGLISGEPLIPESLTAYIPLTECDYKRIPLMVIPTNHAPDAAASILN